jgi:hypothetical protein
LNLTLCSYSDYFLEDLNILRSAGVDYISARNYEKEIEEDLLKERKVVIDEIPLLSSLGILSDPFKTVDSLGREGRNLRMWSIAFALRINPDEYFYDSLWTGDKSFHFYIAEMIAKKRNIPLKYKYYPVVRDNNGIPFHSDISLTQMDAEKKQLLTDYPKEVINNLLKSGKLEKSEPKGFLFELFEKDTLQKVLTIKEGKEYFLTYGYARELGELPATDCFRILG